MLRRHGGRAGADSGSVSIFVAISVAALTLVAAIVLDSCGRLRDMEFADSVAQEAARAAGQELDQAALLRGDGYQVDRQGRIAQDAADAYLRSYPSQYDLSCVVRFKDDHTVEVNVHKSYHTVLLGQDFPVSGHGTATLVHGVTKAENG